MHFSKTYTQLLLSLPPELRDNAIEYRQLKKIINQIVNELSSLGLKPAVLHELIDTSEASSTSSSSPFTKEGPEQEISDNSQSSAITSTENAISSGELNVLHPRVVYELNSTSGKIEPQLRIWVSMPTGHVPFPTELDVHVDASKNESTDSALEDGEEEDTLDTSGHASLLWAFQQRHFGGEASRIETVNEVDGLAKSMRNFGHGDRPEDSSLDFAHSHPLMREVIVPLVHDTEFYNLLSTKLESISEHLTTMHADFTNSLQDLSRAIADSSHPASMSANFRPFSGVTTHAGTVRVKSGDLKSDLYFWREIFQLYVEAEVFESVGEASRGERTVEESERRLQLFAERVTKQGLGDLRKFKLKQSREALEKFLSLNLFILNVKKFSFANSEATRKILKKHTKRTALIYPGLQSGPSDVDGSSQPLLVLVPNSTPFSFPRILVQAVGQTLLPIIPSVEDYSCLICTSIAFKPIRLSCGHLFCVRCLVKMQKRRKGDCPMCRSPSVLVANRTNVDWALLNFMQDWFPLESRDKLKTNEKEAAEEEMRELGIDPDSKCILM